MLDARRRFVRRGADDVRLAARRFDERRRFFGAAAAARRFFVRRRFFAAGADELLRARFRFFFAIGDLRFFWPTLARAGFDTWTRVQCIPQRYAGVAELSSVKLSHHVPPAGGTLQPTIPRSVTV